MPVQTVSLEGYQACSPLNCASFVAHAPELRHRLTLGAEAATEVMGSQDSLCNQLLIAMPGMLDPNFSMAILRNLARVDSVHVHNASG